MILCTLDPDGTVGRGLGRASHVALASVADGAVTGWEEVEVRWDSLHDEGTEGSHHARIASFLRAHDVDLVLAPHIGPGMVRMLGTMGIETVLGVEGDARSAVAAAASARSV